MWREEVLLEACRLAPDDDGPRLVWADAVGGERGELVVIQCDLARGGLPPAAAVARRRRERELLERHGTEWAGLGAFGCRFEFSRGFVEAIELDMGKFVEQHKEIFQRAPLLRSLTATWRRSAGFPIDKLRELVELSAFSRLSGLHLCRSRVGDDDGFRQYSIENRGDEAMRVLVESGAFAQLRALGISDSGLSTAGLRHLVESDALEHLEKLWLPGHDFGRDDVSSLLSRAARLKSLDLSGVAALVPMLPSVTDLILSGVTDRTLAELGDSRAAATLETLRLSGRLDGFHAFPRLHTLDFSGQGLSIGGVQLGDPRRMRGVEALPSLRRLRFSYYGPEIALRVARTWGPQLEELVLWGKPEPSVFAQLQGHVAGEVLWSLERADPRLL